MNCNKLIRYSYLIILIFCLCVGLLSTAVAQEATNSPSNLSSQVLKIGIASDFPPYTFEDENGEASGFYIELTRELLDEQGIQYEFIHDSWHKNLIKLKTGEVDLHPFVANINDYESFLDFIVITSWNHVVVFVRNNSSINSLNDLEGSEILLERDSSWDWWFEKNTQNVRCVRFDTSEEALEKLSAGQGDAAVMTLNNGLYLARKLKLTNVHSLGEASLFELEARYAVPKGNQMILAVLNDGLIRMRNDGSYDALYDKWFGVLKPTPWISKSAIELFGIIGVILMAFLGGLIIRSRLLKQDVVEKTRALQIKEDQLAHADRLNTLGQLSSSIAHEINQPLSSISQFNSSAKLRMNKLGMNDETLISYINNSIQQAQRAGEIIRRLRTLVTKQPSPKTKHDINYLVKESIELLQNNLNINNVRVLLELDKSIPKSLMDGIQIQQVIINLIRNSIEAMRLVTNSDHEITIKTAGEKDGHILLVVQDNGPGIQREKIDSLFDAYVSSRSDGLGLGLSLCKSIVEAHEGHIYVDQDYKNGAKIDVLLPLRS